MSFVGARWWKFDFHTHTPASTDYAPTEQNLLKTLEPKQWLLSFVEKGIDCVAVTDHNTGSWVDRLKKAAEELAQEGKTIHIFPGVEITANGNIHILAIFDPSKSSADIQAVLGASKFRGEWGKSDSVAEESAENIIDEIIRYGGVAIPAHIDFPSGMCHSPSPLTIQQICKKASAVEVIFPDAEEPDESFNRLKYFRSLEGNLAEVIGSDSHHPSKVGRAFTWVKMSSPTIEGLRLALLDGNSSIRRSEKQLTDPNSTSDTQLVSLTIKDAKYCGRGKPLTIQFNPWLNSIIGGRGSGKSSILEFIRIGMGRSSDLLSIHGTNEVKENFQRFAQISKSRDADGVLLQSTSIQCMLRKQGAYYLLSWSNTLQTISIQKYVDGAWNQESGDPASRFPIKIFSQKQIFDLAKNPNSLLKFIDNSTEVNLLEWKMRWEDQINLLLRLSAQRRELQGKTSHKNNIEGQLLDINQKIGVIEQSEHTRILSDYNRASAQRVDISDHLKETKRTLSIISNSIQEYNPPFLSAQHLSSVIPEELQVIEEAGRLSLTLSTMKTNIESLVANAETQIEQFKTWLNTSIAAHNIQKAETEYSTLVSDLALQNVQNPGQYQELIEKRNSLQNTLNELSKVEVEISIKTTEINNSYLAIVELRKELSRKRASFISEALKSDPSLSFRIEPLGDDGELETTFREVIGKQDGTFSSDIFDQERETGFLLALTKKMSELTSSTGDDLGLSSRLDLLHTFKNDFLQLTSGMGKVLDSPVGKKFSDYTNSIPKNIYDRFICWFPQDKLVVKYSDGKRYKDISQGSAGQKAATILSFLLSYGNEPLILDQPEDDLDNGLITSLIVSKLQENKSRRQIIVVTHNPNIVVNGDSEYVVSLQDRGQIEVTASGSLQDLEVRREVCEIMEGGEEALKQRYKRMVNI
ncbi:hypothetical protein PS938_05581 [Pseudomonas fluorescens]|uniref:Polymerase/histidinol phosphatase N-terminal domain-containing protein n=1 Tax=Pseudomonas fluorescens TaxID=294 RepID=A0A5E7VPD2_PSEFL|nr:AAA family ATPase [Pseudomonas fluorescens]VVQ24315.1 hypothetical protein PS938_05581 [Pseudomonas fluorescens]